MKKENFSTIQPENLVSCILKWPEMHSCSLWNTILWISKPFTTYVSKSLWIDEYLRLSS